MFSKKKICKNIFIIYWDRVEVGSGWNSVSSLGSLVSLVATIVFIYLIYNIFINDNYSSKNPWKIFSYFFKDNEEASFSNTIEWKLSSPITLHPFENWPAQS